MLLNSLNIFLNIWRKQLFPFCKHCYFVVFVWNKPVQMCRKVFLLLLLLCAGTPGIFAHETDVSNDIVWCFKCSFEHSLVHLVSRCSFQLHVELCTVSFTWKHLKWPWGIFCRHTPSCLQYWYDNCMCNYVLMYVT